MPNANTFYLATSKHLDAGSYALVASANIIEILGPTSDHIDDASCELRTWNGTVIGAATDRRVVPGDDTVKVSL